MKQISAFDLDHTLVRSNSSLLFYRYLVSKGVYRLSSLLEPFLCSIRYHFFHLSLTELHCRIFKKFLKGFPLQLVEREMGEFLKRDFYGLLYFPTFQRLRLAQHQGHYTVILSSGPSFVVGPIAEYLGVNEWYSSNYGVDIQGNFSAVESVLLGNHKAECVEEVAARLQTSTEHITAYSDSDLDLPFLEVAGKAVAVNPNARLLKICKAQAWEVI